MVCLHGVNAHAGRFASLAARLGDAYRVIAVDLRGHGRSTWEPPWDLGTHLDDLHDTLRALELERADWMGHSFGGRLLLELIADRPEVVDRAVLLDPAVWVPPHVALARAEAARHERTYASPEEAVDRRYAESALHDTPREVVEEEAAVHLEQGEDGRWRYRYCQAAVVTAYSEMSTQPPPFTAVSAPTLLVLGRDSYIPYDHLLDAHRAALGDRLEPVTVDGVHTLLWDAFDETAGAIERFLSRPPR